MLLAKEWVARIKRGDVNGIEYDKEYMTLESIMQEVAEKLQKTMTRWRRERSMGMQEQLTKLQQTRSIDRHNRRRRTVGSIT
jgi:hypothetical protein